MSAQILDGLAVSRLVRERVRERVLALSERGIVPKLAVIVASQDPASLAYVRMKRNWCEKAGITSLTFEVTPDVTTRDVLAEINRLNRDDSVHGVLVQHPLPPHIDEAECLMALGARKDADGITPESLGRLTSDLPGFRCATPLGIMRLLEHYNIEVEGKSALVIGRSVILGKPAALMLLQKNATVTIAHSRTRNLPELCAQADIVVAAVGRPELVRGEWLKPGCVVVDAGYNTVAGRDKDVGDVHFESAAAVASWITPVPGGVGPMTVATLLSNTVDAAEMALPAVPSTTAGR